MPTETNQRAVVVTDAALSSSPPRHVGIIMDGNGRWAAARGLPRVEGHRRGVEAVRKMVRTAIEIGISYVTIYSFSAENWSRPIEEVADLMGLFRAVIRNDLADLHRIGVKVKIIGTRKGLPPNIRALLDEAEQLTRDNRRLTLIVAFNYGSRQEIAEAARWLAERAVAGEIDPAAIDADMLAAHLGTAGIPDPDLIIRTSGEQRLSNFLMWQVAYSEFVFLPIHWPEFDRQAFESALAEFAARERRFGGVPAGCNAKTGS